MLQNRKKVKTKEKKYSSVSPGRIIQSRPAWAIWDSVNKQTNKSCDIICKLNNLLAVWGHTIIFFYWTNHNTYIYPQPKVQNTKKGEGLTRTSLTLYPLSFCLCIVCRHWKTRIRDKEVINCISTRGGIRKKTICFSPNSAQLCSSYSSSRY